MNLEQFYEREYNAAVEEVRAAHERIGGLEYRVKALQEENKELLEQLNKPKTKKYRPNPYMRILK